MNKYKAQSKKHHIRARIKKCGYVVEDSLTREDILRIYDDADGICYYCKHQLDEKFLVLDHKLSLNKGGANSYSNIVLACVVCNSRKGKRRNSPTTYKNAFCYFCKEEGYGCLFMYDPNFLKCFNRWICFDCWLLYKKLQTLEMVVDFERNAYKYKMIPLKEIIYVADDGSTSFSSIRDSSPYFVSPCKKGNITKD